MSSAILSFKLKFCNWKAFISRQIHTISVISSKTVLVGSHCWFHNLSLSEKSKKREPKTFLIEWRVLTADADYKGSLLFTQRFACIIKSFHFGKQSK